jgi:AraC-like DNA-binding protein
VVVKEGLIGQFRGEGAWEILAGEWAILAERGPETIRRAQDGAKFVALPLPLPGPEEPAGAGLPPRLACLACPRREAVFFVKGSSSVRMQVLARELLKAEEPTVAGRLLRRSREMELQARVLERPELRAEAPCRPRCCGRDMSTRMDGVAAYLAGTLDTNHSLPALARRFYVNEFTLKKAFKERHGMPVFAYLRERRMARARTLLQETDCSVMEAATAVGYSNASHFARAFRASHGHNPGEVLTSSR